MANKSVGTKADPLIPVYFKILQSQKDFLDNLGKREASAYLRKLIDAQMSGHEAEISKLREELRQHEAHANIIKAQISELEATDQRKQAASQGREELINKQATGLLPALRVSGRISEHKKAIEFITKSINDKAKGKISIKSEEIEQELRKQAEAQGVYVYD